MLRVAARAPGFTASMGLRLFETNPDLVAQQRQRLGNLPAKWLTEFDDLGDGPLLVIANEFFDALPIRQFVRRADGWHERLIGLRDGARSFGLSPVAIPNDSMPPAIRDAAEGEVYEIGLAAMQVMGRLAPEIARRGGAILAIDYGHAETRTGATLQAVSRHAYADPLDNPGELDISAHVDFGALGETAAAAGLVVQPVTSQGEFLVRLGIRERAATLAAANPDQAEAILVQCDRLIAPEQMGTLFKVFAAASPGLVPEGFT
jgi:SAM-dependent MidA family methyltransferase